MASKTLVATFPLRVTIVTKNLFLIVACLLALPADAQNHLQQLLFDEVRSGVHECLKMKDKKSCDVAGMMVVMHRDKYFEVNSSCYFQANILILNLVRFAVFRWDGYDSKTGKSVVDWPEARKYRLKVIDALPSFSKNCRDFGLKH